MPLSAEQHPPASRLAVDFPEHDEKIVTQRYTIRLAAPEGFKKAEISIDQGNWQPCRYAVGYWWYDWSGLVNGKHELAARVQAPDGRIVALEPRRFAVELPSRPSSN